MITQVIWGEDDHEKRAKALATTYNSTAVAIDAKPTKIKDLESLVFWGHGDTAKFCGLTPDEFLARVSAWQKQNPKVQTIDILTCNARHKQGGHTDSYTDQLVRKMSSKHSKLRFRGLPILVTKNATVCQYSILKWHPATATWAYIGGTGVDDKMMWAGSTKLEDFMPPRGDQAGYMRAFIAMKGFKGRTTKDAFALKYKYDAEKVKTYNTELEKVRNDCAIVAGAIGSLRWHLADIK